MTDKKTVLTLATLFDFELTGEGSEVQLRAQAVRRNKAGNREVYDITYRVPRWVAGRLLDKFREMHKRDRERLKREGERIEKEIRSLTEEPAP